MFMIAFMLYRCTSYALERRIHMKCLIALLITLLILTGDAYASGGVKKFVLDKDHTTVGFNVSYMIFASVSGRFDNFEGSFIIDRERPENSRADIIIQTASVNTGNEARDADIRGPSLFKTDSYPTMVFYSRRIEMGPDNTGQMTGDLTLLGITKPVTLSFIKGQGADKNFADGFKVTGKIKRSDFGMNAYIKPIGNTVTLLVCYNMEECTSEEVQRDNKPQYNQ